MVDIECSSVTNINFTVKLSLELVQTSHKCIRDLNSIFLIAEKCTCNFKNIQYDIRYTKILK